MKWSSAPYNMEQTNPEVIKEVERGLEHRLSDIVSQTFEKAEWRRYGGGDPEPGLRFHREGDRRKASRRRTRTWSSRSVRLAVFVFEDIPAGQRQGNSRRCSKRSTTRSCRWRHQDGQPGEQGQDLQEHVRACRPELIAEDMQYMGPVRASDVEIGTAEDHVDIVRRLEDAGEIIAAGRGGGEGDGGVKASAKCKVQSAKWKEAPLAVLFILHSARCTSPRLRAWVLIKSANVPATVSLFRWRTSRRRLGMLLRC